MKFERWEQEDGQPRSKIRVVVEQFRFVDRKLGSEQTSGKAPGRRRQAGGRRQPVETETVEAGAPDDTPF